MKAYLLSKFESGIGDTYSTLISMYEAYLNLQKLGYDTTVIFETRRNVYFSHLIKLDVIFNINLFHDVIYNIELDISGNPNVEKVFNVKRIEQNHRSYHIFVDKEMDDLRTFKSYIYGHPEIKITNRVPENIPEFLNKEVLNLSLKDGLDVENVVGLHYRALDTHGDIVDKLDVVRDAIDIFAEHNQSSTIIVSSNGNLLRNYMKDKYKNIYTYEFTNKTIPFYPCYVRHREDLTEDDFILHAREIAAEMSLYKYCKKIISFSPFLSNFVTYGILNNVNSKNYFDIVVESV